MNDTVILVTREGMGSADPALQRTLISTYMKILLANESLPGAICFYADGVKLVVEGSPIIDVLRELEEKGVHLIVCKTCLSYFGLTEKVRVGVVGGMGDIVAAQVSAAKVITI